MATKDAVRTFQAESIVEAIGHGSKLFEIVQVKPNSGAFAVVPYPDSATTSPGDTTGKAAAHKINFVDIALFSTAQSTTDTTTGWAFPKVKYINNSTSLIKGMCSTSIIDLRILLIGSRNN